MLSVILSVSNPTLFVWIISPYHALFVAKSPQSLSLSLYPSLSMFIGIMHLYSHFLSLPTLRLLASSLSLSQCRIVSRSLFLSLEQKSFLSMSHAFALLFLLPHRLLSPLRLLHCSRRVAGSNCVSHMPSLWTLSSYFLLPLRSSCDAAGPSWFLVTTSAAHSSWQKKHLVWISQHQCPWWP